MCFLLNIDLVHAGGMSECILVNVSWTLQNLDSGDRTGTPGESGKSTFSWEGDHGKVVLHGPR